MIEPEQTRANRFAAPQALCEQLAPRALKLLRDVAVDEKAKPRARRLAALTIFDYFMRTR